MSLTPKEAAAFFRKAAVRQAAIKGLRSAALRGVQDIVTRIIPSRSPRPVDRGLFAAGFKPVDLPTGAAIENREPHAPYVEYGVMGDRVRPGRAMIDALVGWVERHGLATGDDARSAAFAIARSLQAKGIFRQGKGMRILEEWVTEKAKQTAKTEVARELKALFKGKK